MTDPVEIMARAYPSGKKATAWQPLPAPPKDDSAMLRAAKESR